MTGAKCPPPDRCPASTESGGCESTSILFGSRVRAGLPRITGAKIGARIGAFLIGASEAVRQVPSSVLVCSDVEVAGSDFSDSGGVPVVISCRTMTGGVNGEPTGSSSLNSTIGAVAAQLSSPHTEGRWMKDQTANANNVVHAARVRSGCTGCTRAACTTGFTLSSGRGGNMAKSFVYNRHPKSIQNSEKKPYNRCLRHLPTRCSANSPPHADEANRNDV